MSYTHLSQSERYQFQRQHKAGLSNRQIAESVAAVRLRSIANFVATWTTATRLPRTRRSVQRRHAASARPRIDEATWAAVDAKLREQWSPMQIVGAGVASISHERIYR